MRHDVLLACAIGFAAALPVHAHISYTGRDLGTYNAPGSATINQNVSSNYGWADASDADWGDSHRGRYFRFTLNAPFTVTITATGNAAASGTTFAALAPGFTLYSGLAPAAAHDYSDVSEAHRLATASGPTEGSWRVLNDFTIGNDSGVLATMTYIGHAVDGPAMPMGWTPTGMIAGDGVVDGMVSKTFTLGGGTYTIGVGGVDYAAQSPSNLDALKSYGVSMNLAVAPVPEPASYALMLAGLACLGWVARRRSPSRAH